MAKWQKDEIKELPNGNQLKRCRAGMDLFSQKTRLSTNMKDDANRMEYSH